MQSNPLKQKTVVEFGKLSKIPVYMLDNILDQTKKIRDLIQGFDSIYPDLLEQIDQIAYDGDEEQFKVLIQKGLDD